MLEDIESIYTEMIMEHSKSSHNRRKLKGNVVSELGHNPSCGDEITIEMKQEGDRIIDLAFLGNGCAISQASTSMMIDLIKGKTKQEAIHLIELFLKMIKREVTDEEELKELEDVVALKNISNMPARVKCAVLAWHTLEEMLKK